MQQSTLGSHAAFIDAYGDTCLDTDKNGVTTHFIITAVMVAGEGVQAATEAADQVRQRHFGRAEMKSSGIRGTGGRRLRILADLAQVPFRFYSVVVDKRILLKDSGLRFKGPYLKFLHSILFTRLHRTFPSTRMVVDEHGYLEFMTGFQKYVDEKYKPNLFQRRIDFSFVRSSDSPLVQVADMVSGSLARVFDPKKNGEQGKAILDLLRPLALHVEEWPAPKTLPPFSESPEGFGVHDLLVYEYCVQQAHAFIDANRDTSDDDLMLQVGAAEYLLHHLRFEDANEYVPLGRLADALSISAETTRRSVISKLRDSGVLIASSAKGYKIPSCERDMQDYVQVAGNLIVPLLRRLQEARRALTTKSEGGLDILAGPQHAKLRKLLSRPEGEVFGVEEE